MQHKLAQFTRKCNDKILCSADWHIILHKKESSIRLASESISSEMFRKLIALEQSCDVHIIAGDIFDKKPEPDEICLFSSYINSVTIPTYIIPGNHEATKKGESFFEYFTQENAIKNENVMYLLETDVRLWWHVIPVLSLWRNADTIIYQSMWR